MISASSAKGSRLAFARGPSRAWKIKMQTQNAGGHECGGQKFIRARFLFAAFLPEHLRGEEENHGHTEAQRNCDPFARIGERPAGGDGDGQSDTLDGKSEARI